MEFIEKTKKKNGCWYGLYKCSCGNIKEIRVGANTKSCGCLRKLTAIANGKMATKHNMSYSNLYRRYTEIKSYCNKNCKNFRNKTICNEWSSSFDNFKSWALANSWKDGYVIFCNNHYSPETCIIIPSKESKQKNRKLTNINKYGVENYQCLDFIKDKVKKTCLKKYEVDNPMLLNATKLKSKKTCLKKYGKEHHMKLSYYKDLFRQKTIDSGQAIIYNGKTISEISEKTGLSKSHLIQKFNQGFDIELLKRHYSSIELKVQSILCRNNLSYEQQFRINNKVADFKVGNLIIECDGLYWHSEAKKDKDYHKEKRELYIKNGLIPLFFYEDEILNKEHIVESIILNKLDKSNRIYARECEIKELNTKDSNLFFEQNHLMGRGSGKTIGLFYKNEPVCCLRFKKYKDGLDISRFCPKLFTSVIGGYSRLIKFIEKLNPAFIQTFIDLRYGSGEYLENFGFVKSTNHISFNWIKDDLRIHRLRFPGNSGYKNGFLKIYDCGQLKYIKSV